MNGSIFNKGHVYVWDRFRDSGSHNRTTITPVTPTHEVYIVRLTVTTSLSKFNSRQIDEFYLIFPEDSLCHFMQICMKWQSLFFGKKETVF